MKKKHTSKYLHLQTKSSTKDTLVAVHKLVLAELTLSR